MKTLFTLVALTLTTTAFAADSYTCKGQDGTVEIKVYKSKLEIRASEGAEEYFGKKQTAKFDPTYKPRKEHVGSLRYEGSNDCGSYDAIVDKNIAESKDSGRLIFSQDCDSDGTGARWVTFSCR